MIDARLDRFLQYADSGLRIFGGPKTPAPQAASPVSQTINLTTPNVAVPDNLRWTYKTPAFLVCGIVYVHQGWWGENKGRTCGEEKTRRTERD